MWVYNKMFTVCNFNSKEPDYSLQRKHGKFWLPDQSSIMSNNIYTTLQTVVKNV